MRLEIFRLPVVPLPVEGVTQSFKLSRDEIINLRRAKAVCGDHSNGFVMKGIFHRLSDTRAADPHKSESHILKVRDFLHLIGKGSDRVWAL